MEPKYKDHNPQDQSKAIERTADSTSVKKQRREIAYDDPDTHQKGANQSKGIVWLIQRINWVSSSSILIAAITACFLWYSNQLTRQSLTENASQFRGTLQEMREQTAAAQDAAGAARDSATAASKSAEAASRQVAAAQEQIDVDIDALRLDQRPWLGYRRHAIESKANDTSKWEERDPQSGEHFRVRLFVQNVGKTPALNVRLMRTQPVLIREGARPNEPKKEQWQMVPGKYVVFPNDRRLSHVTSTIRMPSNAFSTYSNRKGELFFWARLEYCDTTGQHHWTQMGLARHFQAPASEFRLRASSVSPDPGEANHPGCRN